MAIEGASVSDGTLIAIEAGKDGTVTLPSGFSYANADFVVSGEDLVLVAPDGGRTVIEGYFDTVPPPDLVSPDGGLIAGQMVALLAHPAVVDDMAQPVEIAAVAADAHAVGHVENVAGTVVAIHADGTRAELASGDALYNGDTVETGHAGSAGIVLDDNSTISMGEGARTVLDNVVFDASTGHGAISLSVDAGNVVVAAGLVAANDPDAMMLSTPMAEVAVRDAQLGVTVPADGPERFVLMEAADGFVGEVAVHTHVGIPEILDEPNEGLFVVAGDAPPTSPHIFVLDEVIHAYNGPLMAMPSGVGAGNDFGIDHHSSAVHDLGEEPAVESSTGEDHGGAASDATHLGGVGDFETAAGGGIDAGTPDFIHVAGAGSTLTSVEPVTTEPGSYSVPPTSTAPVATSDENPPPVPSGPNVIQGTGGPDVLVGTAGDDSILGGAGNDTIDARAGNDTIDGGPGDDVLRGGLGDDRIFGGGGDDAIVFSPGDGNDTVADFGLGDKLTFENATTGNVDVHVSGNDLVIGVTNGSGAEVNNVTIKDGASYTVTETQDHDNVVIAIDPNASNANHGG